MPSIILSRQRLYDRAWTTPLDPLAKELGLSGRGLGKLCDRHDIPVPPRGWWAKDGWAPSTANTSAGGGCEDGDACQIYLGSDVPQAHRQLGEAQRTRSDRASRDHGHTVGAVQHHQTT